LRPDVSAELKAKLVNDSSLKVSSEFVTEFVEDKENWFVANLPPEEARKYIKQTYGDVARVERNDVFNYPFSACDDSTATNLPAGKDIPPGIVKMGGPLQGSPPARKVWIVDS